MPAARKLTWEESAALTRLTIGYCLGRGLLSQPGKSYALIIHHPFEHEAYAMYQWKRLQQFLPTCPDPGFVASYNPESKPGAGNWRIRVGSKWFETAYRLLYPQGEREITSAALELIGAEGIGALWADRGRIVESKRARGLTGQLNLLRYSWPSAQLVHDWIYTLTGAAGRIGRSLRGTDTPMIYYSTEDIRKLISAISHTWMAQAPCLQARFHTNELQATEDEKAAWAQVKPAHESQVRQLRRSHVIPRLDPDAWMDEPPLIATESNALVIEPPVLPFKPAASATSS